MNLSYLTSYNLSKFVSNFWDKVDVSGDNECWIWQGASSNTVNDPYGKISLPRLGKKKKVVRAHRVAFALKNGDFNDSMIVRHRCDNPKCVNPNHLELGTHQDNMQDMVRRGRAKSGGNLPQNGSNNGNSKLTDLDICEILNRINSGETNVSIASDYPVTHSMISRIRRNKNWNKGATRLRAHSTTPTTYYRYAVRRKNADIVPHN